MLPGGNGTRGPLEIELLMRGLRALTFLVILLLALGLGLHTPPVAQLQAASFLLLPAPVVAAQFVHVGLVFLLRVLVAFLYTTSSLWIAYSAGLLFVLILIMGALAWREGTFSG